MNLGRDQLRPVHSPLVGFGGMKVQPVGTISLPVVVGAYPQQVTRNVNFLVVDCLSSYNAIIGKPTLNSWKAVISTYHLLVKFPTEYGVGEDIPLDKNDPGKSTRIGVDLEAKIKNGLIRFLKENIVVFAWSHEDMPGIDPSVITYRLNVYPSSKPVRQKKKVFAPERDNAIKEEVQKLTLAKFIREVYYPDWLANVVMVKKANRKWRMCVDFTDLNKAYPKDSYPLPRID